MEHFPWLWASAYLVVGMVFGQACRSRSPLATGGWQDAVALALFILAWPAPLAYAIYTVVKKRSTTHGR